MFSAFRYSEMLVDMPTDLLHSESARLTNELGKLGNSRRRKADGSPIDGFEFTIKQKIALIDCEIVRRDRVAGKITEEEAARLTAYVQSESPEE